MIAGLKLVREIKNNERFISYEAELGGKKVFAKRASGENTALHLRFQAKNMATVNEIGGRIFRAPAVLAADENWLVSEWIDGQTLEEQIDSQPKIAAEVVAKVAAVFDAQADAKIELRPIFTSSGLAKRVNERIESAVKVEADALFQASLKLFKSYQPSLKACLQDADVQPEHLFRDPTQAARYVLIDSEHLNQHWPRFYDLANNYSKFWKRDNRAFSKQILNEYVKLAGFSEQEIFKPLVASLIVRAFALHWEADYDPGALSTNIPRSQELLRACLAAKNLSDLLY